MKTKETQKTARETLIDGARDLKKLTAEIDRLEATLGEARRQSAKAAETLEAFAGLDGEIAKFRIDAIKAGRNPRLLSEQLKTKATEKRDAEEEGAFAAETEAALTAELKAAKEEAKKLQSRLTPAGVDVLFAEMIQPLYAEWSSHSTRIAELQKLLLAFKFWVEIDGRWQEIGHVNLSQPAEGPSSFAGNVDVRADQTKRWSAILEKLIADPSIELHVPALIRPEDYDWATGRPVLKS